MNRRAMLTTLIGLVLGPKLTARVPWQQTPILLLPHELALLRWVGGSSSPREWRIARIDHASRTITFE